tara:strand:- start:440 stop:1012 length:573 start_codon:yes stop_codon:yes gene_type:complete
MDKTENNYISSLELKNHSELLRRVRERTVSSRSTYTANNLAKVKPIIDKLLNNQKDILVTSEETGYTANTLYVKLVDGFKFLVDNSTEYGPIYAELRSQVSLKKTDTGVLIYFKDTLRNQIKAKELEYNFKDSSVWRRELLAWLQTAEDMDTWRKENLVIKPEDIKWLEEKQKITDFEFDTAEDKLTIIR